MLTVKKLTFYELINFANSWQNLLNQTKANKLFLSWTWIYNWWECFKEDSFDEQILLVFDKEKLVAIFPLYLKTTKIKIFQVKRLEIIGSCWLKNTTRSEYLDIICLEKYKNASLKAVFNYIFKNLKFHDFVMQDLWVKSSLYNFLKNNKNYYKRIIYSDNAYFLEKKTNFDNYKKSLSYNSRRKIFLQRNKLNGPKKKDINNKKEIKIFLKKLNQLKKLRTNTELLTSKSFKFHLRICTSFLKSNNLKLNYLIDKKGNLSLLYNINLDSVSYNIQSGFRSAQKNMSLGLLHFGFSVETFFANKEVKKYNFLAGQGLKTSYKKKFNPQIQKFFSLQIVNSCWLRVLYKLKFFLYTNKN